MMCPHSVHYIPLCVHHIHVVRAQIHIAAGDNIRGVHCGLRSIAMNQLMQPSLPLWENESPLVADSIEQSSTLETHPASELIIEEHDQSALPPIIHTRDLPGGLSRAMLIRHQLLIPLDMEHAYRATDGESLYGRARIVQQVLPPCSIACGMTAAWIWLGGEFPPIIEILSHSHFRTPLLGRLIKTRSRNVPKEQLTRVDQVQLTSPERTACDLALSSSDVMYQYNLQERILELMRVYQIEPTHCLQILEGCTHMHSAKQAREVISDFTCIA